MDIDYADGSLLAFWYDSWIVLVGFGVALMLAVIVLARASWNQGGLVLKTVMVVAVLAVLPLTLIRVGLKLALNRPSPRSCSSSKWRKFRIVVSSGRGPDSLRPTNRLTDSTSYSMSSIPGSLRL